MKTIDDFNFKDKKAIVRVDFNVPVDENFVITDASRIEKVKPTLFKILEDGGSIILMTHFGRPKGNEDKYSLNNLVSQISDLLGVQVKFSKNCVGQEAENNVNQLENGEILLLENLRFHSEEKAGGKDFAEKLSKLGDIYVNDAFGTAHRAHASTSIIADFFNDQKCLGYLFAKEIESLDSIMKNGKRPVLAIIGGAKISTKIPIIKNIFEFVDEVIIGGGMAYTFIKAQGGKIGDSLVEDDQLEEVLNILKIAKEQNVKLHLPQDVLIADRFDNLADTKEVPINDIPDKWMGLDIGSQSIEKFKEIIQTSETILWNGPVGVFEMPSFERGTKEIAHTVVEKTKKGGYSLVGGGDSVSASKKFNLINDFSYVSTGGGALLEFLEGKSLPAITSLS